ncbi:hypothetical protein WA556_001692 [Blastocystis sp. ATCC 50177/Nand II]
METSDQTVTGDSALREAKGEEERQANCHLKEASVSHPSDTPISSCLLDKSEPSHQIIGDVVMESTGGVQTESDEVDLSRSVRRNRLNKSLGDRPPLVDMIQRGLINPDVSRPLSDRLQKLERHMKEDSISRSLQNRSNMSDLVRRGIQTDPSMTPLLRSKMGELEMKMKKHMMEQNLFHRPSPKQLRQSHPGVYASLSEDAKRSMLEKEGTAMVKVYVSFIESTLEQMLVSGKISAEQYNRLYSAVNEEGGAVRKELLEAVACFTVTYDVESYEKRVLAVLH